MGTKASKATPLFTFIASSSSEGVTRTNKVIAKLARKSKLSVETVYRAARNERTLRLSSATALSKATGGKVTAAELLGV